MHELLYKISDSIGIVGVVLLLIAFYLLNTERLSSRHLSYQWLNLLGAAFILFSLFFHWNLSAVIIETVWILISLIGIYKGMKQQS